MQKKRQQRQVEKQTGCSDEKLFAAFEEINFLHKQVETQNLHLQHKQQQIEEVEQELEMTNQDVCITLMPEGSQP
ncbi:hypothetical protein SD80_000735 [Scytonema tolypothrichoides VB-61278]|nr:hypothetical protein SD80_000735 [Scytonema tolypothrichoides VB-61278]